MIDIEDILSGQLLLVTALNLQQITKIFLLKFKD